MSNPMRFLTLAAAVFLSVPSLSQDAAMFRGNPQHTGIYDSTGPTQSSAVKWKFHTGGSVISSPAIANGMVYVGSGDHNLYAIDLDGTLKWKFKTKSRVASSPAVANGVVYCASWDGVFYAVDAVTGQSKWQFQTGGEHRFTATHLHGSLPATESMPDPFDVYLSSPAVWHDAVYFGSGDNNVYALDAGTGKVKWKFKTGDVVHASPAISDGTLYIGSWDSYFYALDASTGKEKWRFKTGEDADTHNQVGIQSSAAVADGIVYFGCRDSNFYALDADTGKQKWKFNNKGSWVISSPAVQNGKVYFATSDTGLLYAFDAQSGTQISSWSSKQWPMFSSPAIAGGMMYIGSEEGKLMAVNLASHEQSWILRTDASSQNGPTYTKPDGTPNYDAAFSDDFYDDMQIGVGKLLSVGAIFSSPVIADNVLYVGSTDGNLYALK
jgi:eukaryotic-like serine/threonine-protein kinase